MSKPPAPCSKCKGEMSPAVHDPFHGEEGDLRLTISEMPHVACAQGHKRFASLSFSAQLMDLIASTDNFQGIPSATKKGLLRKRYHCPRCDQELPAAPTGHVGREVVAELANSQPFKAVIQVPVFRCGGCQAESVRSVDEAAGLALKATGHAFRSIDIHPT